MTRPLAPLVVVGGGRMGDAIIGGLLAAGVLASSDIVVGEPDAARRADLEARHGITCVADAAESLADASVALLAVKPQLIDAVATGLAPHLGGTLVISIAAGITCSRLESLLGAGTPVVRVMPNTPALVGAGMAVVSGGSAATPEDVEVARALFAAVGRAVVLDERHQDAATAISGSGPAYVAVIADALASAGAAQGLPRDVALQLAVETVRGTAELMDRTGLEPSQVVAAVASPGGTTVAALAELEAGDVSGTIAAAVRAAVRRAKELGA